MVKGKYLARTDGGKAWMDNAELFFDGLRASCGRRMLRDCPEGPKICGNSISLSFTDHKGSFEATVAIDPLSESEKNKIVGTMGDSIVTGGIDDELTPMLLPSKDQTHVHCGRCGDGIYCRHVAAALFSVGQIIDSDRYSVLSLRDIDTDALVRNAVKDSFANMLSKANNLSDRIIPDCMAEKLFKL